MRTLKYEHRLLLWSLAGGLPAVVLAMVLLWYGHTPSRIFWPASILIISVWLGCAFGLMFKTIFSLRTLSNLLGALREGDYTLRASQARHDDVMGDVLREANQLGEGLREQRLSSFEARTLLQKIMMEIDVAVFAFDDRGRLRMINRQAERLLGQSSDKILGAEAEELGLAECLTGESPRILENTFPGEAGRWELRRGSFREQGAPHQLILLSDLTRALHEEERQAWQRLFQILRHEMNNSLAPISSIAESMLSLLADSRATEDLKNDLRQGLAVIAERSEALHRFIEAYSKVTRLPQPQPEPVDVPSWVHRVLGLETRLAVTMLPGPEITIQADSSQMDQLLINLVRNAVDAVMESGTKVEVGWEVCGDRFQLWVDDDGPGLKHPEHLFIPFFTTKPDGAGIGLALCRQIAEAHHGTLTLKNHTATNGCRAMLELPIG